MLCGQVVEVDVGVGAGGIGHTGLLAAGVGYLGAVGAPAELLGASEGQHGAFVGLALQDVLLDADGVSVHGCQKDVGNGADVLVPVLVVHVVDDEACGQGQVLLLRLYAAGGLHLTDEDDHGFVGREEEAFQVASVIELSAVGTGGVHGPQVACAEEGDAIALVDEGGLRFAAALGGEYGASAAVGVDEADGCADFVGCDVGGGHGVGHPLAVGAGCLSAHAVHRPERFRCHKVAGCHGGGAGCGHTGECGRSDEGFT